MSIGKSIGKIVKSESHITYICRIFGPREADEEPESSDYAFGRFVRVAIKPKAPHDNPYANIDILTGKSHEPTSYAVGVIYDTILQNPAFGALGPRLSNEIQVEIFSPDYIAEKAVLIYIMILGMVEQRATPDGAMEIISTMHGVPLLSLELDSEIEPMSDDEVQAFHYFCDPERTGRTEKYLHMGYLPHIIAQRNSLLPMVTLRIIDQLEHLFPQHLSLLSIVKRNFAWRLKVETTG